MLNWWLICMNLYNVICTFLYDLPAPCWWLCFGVDHFITSHNSREITRKSQQVSTLLWIRNLFDALSYHPSTLAQYYNITDLPVNQPLYLKKNKGGKCQQNDVGLILVNQHIPLIWHSPLQSFPAYRFQPSCIHQ